MHNSRFSNKKRKIHKYTAPRDLSVMIQYKYSVKTIDWTI
jgi:hypothetical protein